MMVKICGITNAEDALLAAGAGANAVGFNFYRQSPRHVDPGQAAEIGAQLPASVLKVGIFVDDEADAVAAIAAEVNLDVLQLYGECQARHARVWRARRVDGDFSESSLDDAAAEAFLLDSPAGGLHGGTGQIFDWSAARGLKRRIILAGGLDASNVRAAIQSAQPWGVDACSRLERAPGRKDPVKVREFIKAALNL
jgi:phosphoribosylanthranilate isomerase